MRYFLKIFTVLGDVWLVYWLASLLAFFIWNHQLAAQRIYLAKQNQLGPDIAPDEANDKPIRKKQKQQKQRSFRYIFSSDFGFLLGFNGRRFIDSAEMHLAMLQPSYKSGSSLRYGFSGTLNFGMSWFIGSISNFSSSRAGPNDRPILFYRWKLGFTLRNMFSVGKTSLTYFNQKASTDNFYNQQDFRIFYAFQPVITINYMITPVWELQFFTGPSFNMNIYQKSFEEFLLFGQHEIYIIDENFADSPSIDVFSLGAVAGVSLARYFYSTFSAGISTQFVLNVSPYQGPYAWDYNLGNFVFALFFQLSL